MTARKDERGWSLFLAGYEAQIERELDRKETMRRILKFLLNKNWSF